MFSTRGLSSNNDYSVAPLHGQLDLGKVIKLF